jgi:hypothetical protein
VLIGSDPSGIADGNHGGSGGREKADYSQPFPQALLTLLGVALMASSLLLTRYAVERADYLHIVLVVLAFPLFLSGALLLLEIWGLLRP